MRVIASAAKITVGRIARVMVPFIGPPFSSNETVLEIIYIATCLPFAAHLCVWGSKSAICAVAYGILVLARLASTFIIFFTGLPVIL